MFYSCTHRCPKYNSSKSVRMIAFLALVTYVCAYSFSFGPVTWILLSEIFPPAIKGRAMATATAVNWAMNVFVSGTFIQASSKLIRQLITLIEFFLKTPSFPVEIFSLGGVYLIYAILCLVSILFVLFVVPETRNKSLEEISSALKHQ